jgi:hypothetical protein
MPNLLRFEIAGGRISASYVVRNRDKLARAATLLDS